MKTFRSLLSSCGLVAVALVALVALGWSQPAPQGIVVVPDSPQIRADIRLAKDNFLVGERIQIEYEVSVDAYVYIIDIDAEGRVTQLFPNAFSQDNFVAAGTHVLPDKPAYSLVVTPPAGTEFVQIIASLRPLALGPEGFAQNFPVLGDDPGAFQQEAEAAVQGIAPQGEVATAYAQFEVRTPSSQTNQRPTAAFSFFPVDPVRGEPVTFDASASVDPDGRIRSYEWDFQSDGRVDATGVRVSVRLNTAATFPVKLTVTDDDGAASTITQQVRVRAQALNQPPIARFTVSPVQPQVGESVSFDASSSFDPDGTITQYLWDLTGNGQIDATGQRVSGRYNNAGTARITLTVVDNNGGSSSSAQAIQVRSQSVNQPPQARFSFSPQNPTVGAFVTFDASGSTDSDGVIQRYEWDFDGDGFSDAGGLRVTRTFQSTGRFNVTLTVFDEAGASASTSQVVTVGTANQRPQARFSVNPTQPFPGQSVSFDASSSFDPDGFIVQYQWDFDGDGFVDANGVQTSRSFPSAGSFQVTLIVVDNGGASTSVSQTVTVRGGTSNQPPQARFSFDPQNPTTSQSVLFDASGSTDPDGFIAEYRWDFNGDGATDLSGRRVVTRFSSPGTFRVVLTVVDNQGATASTEAFIRVSATQQSPQARFTVEPSSVQVGGTAVFDASSSSDPDGTIVDYRWDFQSDGQTDLTGQRVAVRFQTAGTFRVTLTVVDDDGLTGSASQFIQVGQTSSTAAAGYVIDTPEPGLIRLRVQGQDNWAGQNHAFEAVLETNDVFASVSQATEGGPAPQGVAPVPNEPKPAVTLGGLVQDNTVTYLIRVSGNATEVKFTLRLDLNADGSLETLSSERVLLGPGGAHPQDNPFLFKFNANELLLTDNDFQVCRFLIDRPGFRITSCAPFGAL